MDHSVTCIIASLIATVPDEVFETIFFFSLLLLLNRYTASGFSLSLINLMLSSIFSSCIQNDELSKYIDQMLLSVQVLRSGKCPRTRAQRLFSYLTVIIGRNGPKISSIIMAESRGGSSKIVGSINLHNSKHSSVLSSITFDR